MLYFFIYISQKHNLFLFNIIIYLLLYIRNPNYDSHYNTIENKVHVCVIITHDIIIL